ncbi:MAG: hypothetical protein AB1813_18105 [Verrucomicrobiota bacterium]
MRPTTRSFWFTIACLAALLALIFHKSFHPDFVLFANDAPLGPIKAQEGKGWSNFLGVWIDLNWLGAAQPSAVPNVSNALVLLLGPVNFAKAYNPLSLLFIGLSAWLFFRSVGWSSLVALLAALAAILNMNTFSHGCWGLPSRALTMGSAFLAMAAIVSGQGQGRKQWAYWALAGMAVGLGISEGYDVGAIFSLYVAGFALFLYVNRPGKLPKKLGIGIVSIAVVALFAALLSAQALSTLVGTQVKGIAGLQQDQRSTQERWDWATQWSLPKIEALRVLIPGLFGYRIVDAEGKFYPGSYWGRVGQQPGWDQHHQGLPRHSGAGEYAGVLVVLLAAWAVAQASRGDRGLFPSSERNAIWFWTAMALLSLLLAFGRHAPFYQLVYGLPFFSTIRNPIKFMHPFHLSLLVLFGYGLHGLTRQYLDKPVAAAGQFSAHLKRWWSALRGFDRQWVLASAAAVVVALLGWLLYASSRNELLKHLKAAGFDDQQAPVLAGFSFGEVGLFILFLALSVALVTIILSGWFSGPRVKWAGVLLTSLLTIDLVRANLPWIVYYNYKEKYASNPVLEFLEKSSHEQRVATKLFPFGANYLLGADGQFFANILNEWLQHHFQYYKIQSLDIIQMPRIPELDNAYVQAMAPRSETEYFKMPRLWQLTNTRFLIGQKSFLAVLNDQFDPQLKRFRVHTAFDVVPKPGVAAKQGYGLEDLTIAMRPEGNFAIFEMTGVLARAQLFSHWQVLTNDTETLQQLSAPGFDPHRVVLVSDPITPSTPMTTGTATNEGTVAFVEYEPKRIQLRAEAKAPSILLLNDKFDPHWQVTVDGKPAALLRCNFIMRGVQLSPGTHQVEFHFKPPVTGLYISLAAIAVGLVLCGMVVFSKPDGNQGAAGGADSGGGEEPSKS